MALEWTKEGEEIVKAPGIIDICWKGDDPLFQRDPIDLFYGQEKGLDESYGKKDKKTGIQSFFWCHLCECDMMSIKTLRYHSNGAQHQLKACGKEDDYRKEQKHKREIELQMKGDPDDIQVGNDLYELLSQEGNAIVGLRYITEFIVEDKKPLYHCCLTHCKNAQGDAKQMSRHILSIQHRSSWIKEDQDNHLLVTKEAVCSYAEEHREDLTVNYRDVRQMVNKLDMYRKVMMKEFRVQTETGLPPLKAKSVNQIGGDVKRFKPDISAPEISGNGAADLVQSPPDNIAAASEDPNEDVETKAILKRFKRKIADIVKQCLNRHYAGTEEFIPGNAVLSREEYIEEAKNLTMKMLRDLSNGYHATYGSLQGLKMTPDHETNIKTYVLSRLEKKLLRV